MLDVSKKVIPYNMDNMESVIDIAAAATQATLVTVVGYPFDLIKTKMQVGEYNGSIQCLRSIIKNEGPLALYRGASAPWLSHMMKRPIQFPLAELMKSHMTGVSNNYIIGGATGALGPLFGTPIQVVKVGMQTSKIKTSGEYTKMLWKTSGVKGFYRGFVPTMFKDTLFGASFVGHYLTLRDYFESQSYNKWITTFISGSSAHCATWLVFIPIDTIKSKMQRAGGHNSMLTIIKDTIRSDGITSLWRGVIPACLRTIPVSGIGMIGYEYVRSLITT